MSSNLLVNAQLKAGVWEGELAGPQDARPSVQVTHRDAPLEGLTTTFDAARNLWRIRVPIPADLISDGVQTFVMHDGSRATIGTLSLIAGEPLADDLRAEIALLRHELDLLRKAFRRHCDEK